MPFDRDRIGHIVLGLLVGGLLTGWGVHRIEAAARQDLSDAFIVHVSDCQNHGLRQRDLDAARNEALLTQLESGDVDQAIHDLATAVKTHRVISEHLTSWNAEHIVGPARQRMQQRVDEHESARHASLP